MFKKMLLNMKKRILSPSYQCLCRSANLIDHITWNIRNKASNSCPNVETLDEQIKSPSECNVTFTNQFERLSEVMTPLWKMPYEDQLKEKYNWTSNVAQLIYQKLKTHYKGKKRFNFSPKINQILESPVTEEYRNKDEFSVRNGVDGNLKTVGFFIGSTASASMVCVPGTHIVSVKQKHKELAQHFEEYIRTSDLPTCIDFAPGGGNWRRFIVRSNEKGETLAVAICHPQSLPQERLEEEQQKLKEYFTFGPGKDCCPTSLYFQACPHTRCTNQQAPYTLLHGEPFLTEQLKDKTFRISPDSFFQINTKAAEVLYETILRKANLTSRTTMLDFCCGIGCVSIFAGDVARGCVGVDSVLDSIQDARFNAKINNLTNVDFFHGPVEKRTKKILEDLNFASDIVAVVNPGRAGLLPKVVSMLCQCPQIGTVVYVSCKADMPSTLKNFVQLYVEGNFTLKSIVPVDLFPHTWHTELVMTFKR